MPKTRLFVKEKSNVRLLNLHVFESGHPHVREMISLRDYLRLHSEIIKEYSGLKLELYKKYPEDYAEYRKYKDDYVKKLTALVNK